MASIYCEFCGEDEAGGHSSDCPGIGKGTTTWDYLCHKYPWLKDKFQAKENEIIALKAKIKTYEIMLDERK